MSADNGIRIAEIGGNCPVQADGTIDGVPFYFRARGSRWYVEIGLGNTHLVVEAMASCGETDASHARRQQPKWTYGEEYGEWPEAGHMETDEARAFIAKSAEVWRTAGHPATNDAESRPPLPTGGQE